MCAKGREQVDDSPAELVRDMTAAGQDAALLKGLVAGLPEAAREFCDRYGHRLLAFAAARFPHDRPLAEDIMLQTLAKATQHIRQFNPRKATLATWLYGIARQQIQNELRRQRRLKSVPPAAETHTETDAQIPDGRDMAALVAERIDAERRVLTLAEALSALELDVLTLSCIDQLSAREIGQVIGRSERAVHSLLHRARTKAREVLAAGEEGGAQ